MTLKIGLDLDGCPYRFVDGLRDYIVTAGFVHYPDDDHNKDGRHYTHADLPEPTSWNIWEHWPGFDRKRWEDAFDMAIRLGGLFGPNEVQGHYLDPGAAAAWRQLADAGHEIHVVTHRPPSAVGLTAQWLQEVGMPYTSLTFAKDKSTVPVDVIIEDNVDNCLAVIAAGGRAILMDRPWNREWEGVDGPPEAVGGLARAADWTDAMALIVDINSRFDYFTAETRVTSAIDDSVNPKDRIGITKPRLSLVPKSAIIRIAQAFKDGAAKYGPFNWRTKHVSAVVYEDAAERHLAAWFDGEDNASDSGVMHLAHAGACIAILIDAIETGSLIDDRPTPGAAGRLIAELTEVPA